MTLALGLKRWVCILSCRASFFCAQVHVLLPSIESAYRPGRVLVIHHSRAPPPSHVTYLHSFELFAAIRNLICQEFKYTSLSDVLGTGFTRKTSHLTSLTSDTAQGYIRTSRPWFWVFSATVTWCSPKIKCFPCLSILAICYYTQNKQVTFHLTSH